MSEEPIAITSETVKVQESNTANDAVSSKRKFDEEITTTDAKVSFGFITNLEHQYYNAYHNAYPEILV
jgi:hypothetical protein